MGIFFIGIFGVLFEERTLCAVIHVFRLTFFYSFEFVFRIIWI